LKGKNQKKQKTHKRLKSRNKKFMDEGGSMRKKFEAEERGKKHEQLLTRKDNL